jgi:4-hydroxy-2-oxoheptanedioate aldolase
MDITPYVRQNTTKAKLERGEAVFGVYLRHADAGVAEALGYMGWDYLLFDGEHCPLSGREAEHLARVCEITGATPIARVPANYPFMIAQFLDAGMQAVQIPMVGGGEQAAAAVQAARYAPQGARGVAATRPARYGQLQPFTFADYLPAANEQIMVIAQIETREAVGNAVSIAQTPGIDVVFIGPVDLSQSLGHPGCFDHPDVQRAFNEVTDAVIGCNKALGIMVNNLESAIAWRKRGARYIMIVMEALLGPVTRDYLRTAREA